MAIYLGHNTARSVLESRIVRDLDCTPLRGVLNSIGHKEHATKLLTDLRAKYKEFDYSPTYLDPAKNTVDLLVSSQNEKRHWDGFSFHILPPGVPERSFWQVDEDLLVACPELCLLLLANDLSLIETIKVAMSFCGIYRLEGDEESKSIFHRKPVMTVDGALSYLAKVKDVGSATKARRALSYTLPNSGSPMETRMVLPLFLPRTMGGFGLPRPTMNEAIELNDRAMAILGTDEDTCAGDAVWTDVATGLKIILEYQSFEYHNSMASFGRDYARALALESMGHTVIFVSKVQLENPTQLAEIARRVAVAIEYPLPQRALAEDGRRKKLVEEILK